MRRVLRSPWTASIATGLLLASAYYPLAWAPAAWIALVPSGLALAAIPPCTPRGTRRAFGIGYVSGLVFALVGLHWIAFLSKVAVTVPWIMYPAWLGAGFYLALFPALSAAATYHARSRLGLPVAVGWPLFWLAGDWLRAQGEMGTPWLHLGYSQVPFLATIQLASWGGVSLIGAFVASLNGLALHGWSASNRRHARAAWGGAALLAALPFLVLGPSVPPVRASGEPSVALVQGNIPSAVKWSGTHQEAILGKFLAMSRSAAASGARLIVWPETATGSYLRQALDQRFRVQAFVDSIGVPILTGYPDYHFTGPRTYVAENAAGVFWPRTGLGPQYSKIHLVPFGERLPFQAFLPALGRIDLGQAEFQPGTDPTPLPTPVGPVGVLVCFEAIFTEPARSEIRSGATWLVNITNDEWFGKGAALDQHAAMSVVRAVEHRVPLLRCANTGLTLVVDPYGRVLRSAGTFEDHVVVAPLPASAPRPTWFTRHGDLPGPITFTVALLLVVTSLFARRTRLEAVSSRANAERVASR